MKDMSNEDLLAKIEWEGHEYFFLEYVDVERIADLELKQAVRKLKEAWQVITAIVEEIEVDLSED